MIYSHCDLELTSNFKTFTWWPRIANLVCLCVGVGPIKPVMAFYCTYWTVSVSSTSGVRSFFIVCCMWIIQWFQITNRRVSPLWSNWVPYSSSYRDTSSKISLENCLALLSFISLHFKASYDVENAVSADFLIKVVELFQCWNFVTSIHKLVQPVCEFACAETSRSDQPVPFSESHSNLYSVFTSPFLFFVSFQWSDCAVPFPLSFL